MGKFRTRIRLAIVLLLLMVFIVDITVAQEKKLYNPAANASLNIETAVHEAAAQNKFVLIQAGGNWCGWCIEFSRFTKADREIDSVIRTSFIVYHLNWSKENENKKIFAEYQNPQRFGFPVFLVLNEKGKLIHTQNSEYLEDGKKSYDQQKVKAFLEMWSPAALDPAKYDR